MNWYQIISVFTTRVKIDKVIGYYKRVIMTLDITDKKVKQLPSETRLDNF